MTQYEETYDEPGEETVDVSESTVVWAEVYGEVGEDGGSGTEGSGSGGDGGYAEGLIDVEGVDEIDLHIADGQSGWRDGGSGGSGSSDADGNNEAGDGGSGGGSTAVTIDGSLAFEAGGGGGGGGGSNSSAGVAFGGGGGGGGGSGGSSGSGGTATGGDGSSGSDGESGDGDTGGDGGDGGGADSGESGDPGTGYYDSSLVSDGGTETGTSSSSSIYLEYSDTPEKPSDLDASSDTDSITLTWTSNADDGETEIFRSEDEGVDTDDELLATLDAEEEEYVDEDVSTGETWYYALRSVLDREETDLTDEVWATVPLPPPTNLEYENVTDDSVDLSWDLQTDNEDRVIIESSLDGGDTWEEEVGLDPGTESHTLEDLKNGREYKVRVVAEVD